MRRWAPIVQLAWRLATDNRRLRRENDRLKSELSVAKAREKRWRKAAEIMAGTDPELQWLVAKQQWSDDMADLPETTETFPRSIP